MESQEKTKRPTLDYINENICLIRYRLREKHSNDLNLAVKEICSVCDPDHDEQTDELRERVERQTYNKLLGMLKSGARPGSYITCHKLPKKVRIIYSDIKKKYVDDKKSSRWRHHDKETGIIRVRIDHDEVLRDDLMKQLILTISPEFDEECYVSIDFVPKWKNQKGYYKFYTDMSLEKSDVVVACFGRTQTFTFSEVPMEENPHRLHISERYYMRMRDSKYYYHNIEPYESGKGIINVYVLRK